MKLALLRKDLRLLRLPLVGGVLLAVLPYLIHVAPRMEHWQRDRALAGQVVYVRDGDTVHKGRTVDRETIDRLFVQTALLPAALTGLGLVALTAAACGGIAFAAERRDRSAEFLALLPVSRRRAVASKLAAAGVCLLLPACVHLAAFAIGWRELPPMPDQSAHFAQRFSTGAANCAALTVMMFGVAWLLSSVLDSPAVAATVAVGLAAVTVYLIAATVWQAEVAADTKSVFWTPAEYVTGVLWRPGVFWHAPPATNDAVRVVAVLSGLSALLAGGLVQARRVRP